MEELRAVAAGLLASVISEEMVARDLVSRRNALKAWFRIGLDAEILDLIEARNVMKYGDPLGPKALDLYQRYGLWRKVIDAAGRPANLSGRSGRAKALS